MRPAPLRKELETTWKAVLLTGILYLGDTLCPRNRRRQSLSSSSVEVETQEEGGGIMHDFSPRLRPRLLVRRVGSYYPPSCILYLRNINRHREQKPSPNHSPQCLAGCTCTRWRSVSLRAPTPTVQSPARWASLSQASQPGPGRRRSNRRRGSLVTATATQRKPRCRDRCQLPSAR